MAKASSTPGRASAAVYLGYLTVAGLILALLGFVSPNMQRFPLVALAVFTFGLVPLAMPAARLNIEQPACPFDWAIYLFGLQLAVVPLTIVVFGAVRETLTYFPSDASINLALLTQSAAFLAFAIGATVMQRRNRTTASMCMTAAPPAVALPPAEMTGFILAVGAVGIAGLMLRFQSPGSLVDYFTGHAPLPRYMTDPAGHATLAEAISAFLLPCLGLAFVLICCRQIASVSRQAWRRRLLVVTVAAALAVAAFSLFNYNRALAFYPVWGLIAAVSQVKRRVSFRLLFLTAAGLLAALLIVGAAREAYVRTGGNQTSPSSVGTFSFSESDPLTFLQVYGNGPQFLGRVIEGSPNAGNLYYGSMLVASLAEPIPVIGRAARPEAGDVVYNALLFGVNGARDHILPFEGELLWNFQTPGVVVGFAALGALLVAVDRRYLRAKSLSTAYAWQYIGLWIGYIVVGGAEPLAQAALYYFWPALLVLAINRRSQLIVTRNRAVIGPGSRLAVSQRHR